MRPARTGPYQPGSRFKRAFQRSQKCKPESTIAGGEILLATEDLINFQTIVQDGVNSGRIKSILQPSLADHMRRETLTFDIPVKQSVQH